MSGLTTDPEEARNSGIGPGGQQNKYVVLSDEERDKGFVRPVRYAYRHVGPPGPRYKLVDLTPEQEEQYVGQGYVKYESYPESEQPALGRFWTQEQLDRIGNGCQVVTTMAAPIAETYAREPGFYSGTFCAGCKTHLPVGKDGEFVWEGTEERVGT